MWYIPIWQALKISLYQMFITATKPIGQSQFLTMNLTGYTEAVTTIAEQVSEIMGLMQMCWPYSHSVATEEAHSEVI